MYIPVHVCTYVPTNIFITALLANCVRVNVLCACVYGENIFGMLLHLCE